MIIKLAYRNIWRNQRRTLITVLSVACGLTFCLFFTGLQDGGYDKLIDSSARIGTGHLTFEHRAYRDDPDIHHTIDDFRPYVELLKGQPHVRGHSLRISGQGMLSSSYGAVGVYFDGLEPRAEAAVSPIAAKIVTGDYLNETIANGVIIGDALARRLKVDVGSKLVFTANNLSNKTVQELVKVVGTFHAGSESMDGFYFQLPLGLARAVLGYGENEVLQIAVFLQSQRQTNTMLRQLKRQLPPTGATVLLPWYVVMHDLAGYIALDNAGNYILQILAFLIIAAGILNTVLMSVMERTFEFGVMLALGTRRLQVFWLILTETAMIGCLGVIFGSLFGWGLNIYFARHPINLGMFLKNEMQISGFAMEPVLRTGLYFNHYVVSTLLTLMLVVLVGVYPARRAAQLEGVTAWR